MQMHACVRLSAEATAHLADALSADLRRTDQVHWVPPQLWRLRLTAFGHVTRGDAVRLAGILRDRLGDMPSAAVWLARVEPLPFDGDDGVWAHVAADSDIMGSIATMMPRWVHELGFVPDRRAYRAAVHLGRIAAQTELPYLEDFAERLASYEGPPWRVDSIALATLRGSVDVNSEVLGIFEEIPLRAGRAESDEGSTAGVSIARSAITVEPTAADSEVRFA